MGILEGMDPKDQLTGFFESTLRGSYPAAGSLPMATLNLSMWQDKLRDLNVRISKGEDVDRVELSRVEAGYHAWLDEVNDLRARQGAGKMDDYRGMGEPEELPYAGGRTEEFHASGSPLRGQLDLPGTERFAGFQTHSFDPCYPPPQDIGELVGVVKELLFENTKLRSDVKRLHASFSDFKEKVASELNSALLSVRSESTDSVGTG